MSAIDEANMERAIGRWSAAERAERMMALLVDMDARRAEAEKRAAEAEERAERVRDCGQDEVCATPPGCARHWEERNRELARADKGRSRSQRTRAELKRGLRLQGLPEDMLDDAPFTVQGAIHAVGNGVPLPLGRAVARAVREAIG